MDIYNLEDIEEQIKKILKADSNRKYFREHPERAQKSNKKWYDANGKEYHRDYYHKKRKK